MQFWTSYIPFLSWFNMPEVGFTKTTKERGCFREGCISSHVGILIFREDHAEWVCTFFWSLKCMCNSFCTWAKLNVLSPVHQHGYCAHCVVPSNDVSHMEMVLGMSVWYLRVFFLRKNRSASDSTPFGDVSDRNKEMYWQSAIKFPHNRNTGGKDWGWNNFWLETIQEKVVGRNVKECKVILYMFLKILPFFL